MNVGRDEIVSFIGVSKELQRHVSAEDRGNITEPLISILPVSQRYRGNLKEAANHATRQPDAVERIQAPTLVVDAMDMDIFAGARYTAEHIPNAQLGVFESGGHPRRPRRRHTDRGRRDPEQTATFKTTGQ
jgi:hypothetical protein